nr:LysR family transcriptional regulator [uncultured Holophaga sp.]
MADLDLLRSFLGIYRAGTLSAAAKQLGFTQPTLSGHLKALESQLGRPLFKRLPRGMAPTPVAHALAQNLGEHLDAMVATVEAARAGTEHLAGPLHLGGPASLLGAKVLPTLSQCTIWQAGIQLHVRIGPYEEQLQALKSGTLDLMISHTKASKYGLKWEPIFTETLILVGAPKWAQRVRPGAVAEEGANALEGVPLLACDEECHPLTRYFQTVFDREPPEPTLVVNDLRAALSAAVGGLGVTVLPDYLCEASLERGELVLLHEPEDPPTSRMCLVRKPSLKANPRVDLTWDLIRKAAEGW